MLVKLIEQEDITMLDENTYERKNQCSLAMVLAKTRIS